MTTKQTAAIHQDTAQLDAAARALLRANDRGGYTVPTHKLYPFQWNWDAAFSALGWFQFDVERAFLEVDKLLSAQWHNGMVPHIVFHQDDEQYFPGAAMWAAGAAVPSSGYTQPPVLASMLRQLQLRAAAANTARVREKLKEYLPKLMRWHHWFWQERNPTGNGLIAILHPWESGRDNLPDWDAALSNVDVRTVGAFKRRDTQHVDAEMRPHKREYQAYLALVELGKAARWDSQQLLATQPFVMLDVLMTAVLLRANRDLLAMAEELNAAAEAQTLRGWITRTEAYFGAFWNTELGAYCTINYRTGRHVDCISAATFSAFYAGVGDGAQRVKLAALFAKWCTAVKYMVPSFDPYDARFEERRYWRGPVWVVMNYLLAEGFMTASMENYAELIRKASAQLIQRHGFYEYYSAHAADRGLGGSNFSWTAAMWLAWLSPSAQTAAAVM